MSLTHSRVPGIAKHFPPAKDGGFVNGHAALFAVPKALPPGLFGRDLVVNTASDTISACPAVQTAYREVRECVLGGAGSSFTTPDVNKVRVGAIRMTQYVLVSVRVLSPCALVSEFEQLSGLLWSPSTLY